MTFRLTLGVDPGQTGAIAVVADGKPVELLDMPLTPRRAGGLEINGALLARDLRRVLVNHNGADAVAVLERVHAMPKQCSNSGFRFGQADGVVRGVLGALQIGFIEVNPEKWKKHFGLVKGKDEKHDAFKDRARTLAIQRYPVLAEHLARKKDVGRADALLIALWACATDQSARAA